MGELLAARALWPVRPWLCDRVTDLAGLCLIDGVAALPRDFGKFFVMFAPPFPNPEMYQSDLIRSFPFDHHTMGKVM